jgi:signal transduction histidine kinase
MMQQYSDQELLEELKRRSLLRQAESAFSDIAAELRRVNARLQESEQLQSQFLSNVRNEMNNPLAAILGLSEQMIRLSPEQLEQIGPLAALVHAEAFDLDFQLKNIVAAAEMESGEMRVEVADTDVAGIIESLLALYAHRMEQKQIKLLYQNHLPDPPNASHGFRTDPAKLHLVLSNLVANAIEYSHPGGTVSVACRRQDGCLYLSVADEGTGIAAADQTLIFNRFYQLDRGVNRNHRGHGLGLAVAKALLELLGGNILVESPEKKGCAFSCCIPEAPAAAHNTDMALDGNTVIFSQYLF